MLINQKIKVNECSKINELKQIIKPYRISDSEIDKSLEWLMKQKKTAIH